MLYLLIRRPIAIPAMIEAPAPPVISHVGSVIAATVALLPDAWCVPANEMACESRCSAMKQGWCSQPGEES